MWLWFVLAGLFGGLVGGMGLGGGTLLIPILTIILGLNQHIAQGINLLVFIPTAIIALIIHLKNKLVDFKMFIVVLIPAIVSSVICAIFVKDISGATLRKIFGGFLLAIALYELFVAIRTTTVKIQKQKKYKFII